MMSISGKAAHGQQSWVRTATSGNVRALISAVKQAKRYVLDPGAYTGIWKGGDTWGSGGLPPAGSRGSAPVGGQGGEAALKLKGFL